MHEWDVGLPDGKVGGVDARQPETGESLGESGPVPGRRLWAAQED